MNRKVSCIAFMFAFSMGVNLAADNPLEEVERLIESGAWKQARQEITEHLAQKDLSFQARQAWLFQEEKLARIRLDFDKTRSQILTEMRGIVPDISEELMAKWEQARAIEFLKIDGQPWYFNRAAGNVFRVNAEAKAIKNRIRPGAKGPPPLMAKNIAELLAGFDQTGKFLNAPKKFRIVYTLSVKPDVIPAGEVVRAWLPYPHAGGRQSAVRLVRSEPEKWIHSGEREGLSAIYLEKSTVGHQPVVFKLTFDYTAAGFYQPISSDRVRSVNAQDPALAPFLAEQAPHIVFSEELRNIARQLVGEETNPYLKARRLFQWISENIPWAGAREYSTIPSLSQYALAHRWGDCGIQTMLFMTFCRLNGIPARWESGWITGWEKNMHDWCQIYLEPYGWVPVDATFGLVNSAEERVRWFYLGNIDSYRLVVNTDYGQPLYPAKMSFRSEPVDFQRGEVEWRGGNLYYDQWSWDFQVEELN